MMIKTFLLTIVFTVSNGEPQMNHTPFDSMYTCFSIAKQIEQAVDRGEPLAPGVSIVDMYCQESEGAIL